MKWIAFFSMSGSEIVGVSQQLGRYPDVVVTNRITLEGVDQQLLDTIDPSNFIMILNKPSVQDYITALDHVNATQLNALITLHGYLRVIPAGVCKSFNIVNGHPGLITTYPELKGKDPQARAITHPIIGSVLHEVTAGVDEGPIIDVASCDNLHHTVDGVTQQLRHLSQALWVKHLKNRL